MQRVTDVVRAMAEPVAAALDCTLWDVEYLKEGDGWVLRLLIDREDGVSIDHCEAVSRAIDPLLDEADPVPDAYTLEVSSAGLERPLKRPEHFAASLGKLVEVSLYAPKNNMKRFQGILTAVDPVTIAVEEITHQFTEKEISKVKWVFTF